MMATCMAHKKKKSQDRTCSFLNLLFALLSCSIIRCLDHDGVDDFLDIASLADFFVDVLFGDILAKAL